MTTRAPSGRSKMRAPRVARGALVALLVTALSVGVPAALFPRSFYDHYPFFTDWVNLLPPYNQHLVTDVGGLYLGFAVIFGWSAWTLERTAVRAVSAGWAVMSSLHLVFHATHLSGFTPADGAGELVALSAALALPALAVWGVADRAPSRRPTL